MRSGRPMEASGRTFGTWDTLSFYPAHHITMGEGARCSRGSDELRRIVESSATGARLLLSAWQGQYLRQAVWWQLGELPFGYDHKYSIAHGFNLKIPICRPPAPWRRWIGSRGLSVSAGRISTF